MITELYNAMTEAIRAVPEIKHIDLWNQNVEFIDEDEAWDRPAVFIEFGSIAWKPYKGLHWGISGTGEVLLHIVTDWKGSAADGSQFKAETMEDYELPSKILQALNGLSGEGFRNFMLARTETNCNHQDLLENIDVYQVTFERTFE